MCDVILKLTCNKRCLKIIAFIIFQNWGTGKLDRGRDKPLYRRQNTKTSDFRVEMSRLAAWSRCSQSSDYNIL